jgi:predicted enzyme related to lactoylglutathione lyase
MTVTGPDFIALQARDVEAAAAFYENQLGLRRAPAAPPGAVVFATAPIPFAVREPLPGVNLDAVGRPGAGVVLWLKADDAQALHDRLAAAGVRIIAAPADGPFGRQFTFADPEGYVITLHAQSRHQQEER